MATVLFYEKPGCINNTRQKWLLNDLGHIVSPRNLLTEPWTPEHLRGFFADLPVHAWFNASAPRVKSGEVRPHALDEFQALALMCADPLLIRRPLLQVGDERMAGFDDSALLRALGVVTEPEMDLQTCPHTLRGGEVGHG